MQKKDKKITSEMIAKVLAFSKKIPFYKDNLSLYEEANKELFSVFKHKLFFVTLKNDSYDFKISAFEGIDFLINNEAFSDFPRELIYITTKLFFSYDEPKLLTKEKMLSWFISREFNLPEYFPETTLVSPIIDRFGEKLGFMALCSEEELENSALEFFSLIADYVGIGINVVEDNINNLEVSAELEEFLADLPLGIIRISNDNKIFDINDKLAQILGFKSANEFFDEENQKYIKQLEKSEILFEITDTLRNISEGKVVKEVAIRDRYGNKVWLEIYAHYHSSEILTNNYFEGFIIDITEDKKIQKEITSLLITQSTIFDLANEGIVITDENGTILAINKVLTERYRKSPDFLIGKNISVLGGDKQSIAENIRKLSDGKPHENFIEHLTSSGERYFYALSEQLVNFPNGSKRIISYSKDITKQIEAGKNIVKLQNELKIFKEYQILVIDTIAEKQFELLLTLDDIKSSIRKNINYKGANGIIKRIDNLKKNFSEIRTTLTLLMAMDKVLVEERNAEASTFDLKTLLKDELQASINHFLERYGKELKIDVKCSDCKIKVEKEILLKLLTSIIETVIENGSDVEINIGAYSDKKKRKVIEIELGGIKLSNEFLSKTFSPVSSSGEYHRILPHNSLFAKKSEVILSSKDKTKIKIFIS